MMQEIICITTNGPRDDCTCITAVRTKSGNSFQTPEVIQKIRGGERFVVKDPQDGSLVDVKPVPLDNPTYIRTAANDTPRDNLLKLDEC